MLYLLHQKLAWLQGLLAAAQVRPQLVACRQAVHTTGLRVSQTLKHVY